MRSIVICLIKCWYSVQINRKPLKMVNTSTLSNQKFIYSTKKNFSFFGTKEGQSPKRKKIKNLNGRS